MWEVCTSYHHIIIRGNISCCNLILTLCLMQAPFLCNWIINVFSYFCIKVAHCNFHIMCWNCLIQVIKSVIKGILNELVLFFYGACAGNYCKIINFPPHSQQACSLVHGLRIHSCFLSRPTNAQHIYINNILYNISTPMCFSASA